MFRSPPAPFPLWVSIQGPSFDGFMYFPQCMSYPIPFPSRDLCGHLDFPCPFQSSSFEITSGQWMFRILCKERLTKVCSFEVVVFISFHVSDPYNNIDLMLLQKMRSLVLVDICCSSTLDRVLQKHHLLFEFVARHPAQLLRIPISMCE